MRVTTISAATNARFKAWRKLAEGAVRPDKTTLVFGKRLAVETAAMEGPLSPPPVAWIVVRGWGEGFPPPSRFPRPSTPLGAGQGGTKCQTPGPPPDQCPVFELAPELFRELDVFGTHHPILEVSIEGRVEPLADPGVLPNGLNVAVPVQDPVNLGAIVRSAVGLGASSVLLLPGACSPFHPKAVRTSAGAVFRARLLAAHAAIGPVVGLDASGEPIEGFSFPDRFVLLVGQEGVGVSGAALKPDYLLRLPMQGIESYNAGVAAALAMFEWRRRR